MADLNISQGDYGFDLTFTVQTASGGAYSLTGKVATLKVWHSSRPSVLIVSASTTVTDAAGGVCVYNPASTDFMSIGKYICELEMTEAGKIDSTKTYSLEVIESP